MYKADFHTHSTASHDGGITEQQYRKLLGEGMLDLVAITDHGGIDFGLSLRQQLGKQIIVGQEIMTTAGEIIGLYLNKPIKDGLTPHETVANIKNQNGLVYIPHPFENIRNGLHPSVLDELIDHVDIIEVVNGRAFLQNRSEQAVIWAKLNKKLGVASSDAHGIRGVGRTFTQLRSLPTKSTLLEELSKSTPITSRPSARALLYPKLNKLRKRLAR